MTSSFVSIDPYSEKELASYPKVSPSQLEEMLCKAGDAQVKWKSVSFAERSALFLKLAELIRLHADRLASLATLEMGKPIAEGKAEVLKCSRGCEFYAGHAEKFLQPEISYIENNREVQVIYEPMGVILGIFPWNFPYWQIIRSAVPVLMGGNGMLVKPAPNVPQCALALQELFAEAGFPDGIIQTVFADEAQIAGLIRDNRIKACTLTGSERAGSIVASNAARQIKKSVLELGGSDPFIVMEDADIGQAVSAAITARFQNNGQSCIAAKRFILHRKIGDDFIEKLLDKVSHLRLGNPMDPETDIGPLARKDLLDKLASQVDQSIAKGAQVLYQQKEIPSKGFFYPPTVLTNVRKSAAAYKEELFGPVLSIFISRNAEEMIRLANDTSFGLGASLWTENRERAKILAGQIQAGNVFVNTMVKSDPRFPFGGIKRSGFGRELGEQGIKEFCSVKTFML